MYYVIQVKENKARHIMAALAGTGESGHDDSRIQPDEEIIEEFQVPGQDRVARISCKADPDSGDGNVFYAQAYLVDRDGRVMEKSEQKKDYFGEWNIGGSNFMVVAEPKDRHFKYDGRLNADGKLDTDIPAPDEKPGKVFEFRGYHFVPVRKFEELDQEKLRRHHSIALPIPDFRGEPFLEASARDGGCVKDIYRYEEDGRHYFPTLQEMLRYDDPYLKKPEELQNGDLIHYMCPFCGRPHVVRVYGVNRILHRNGAKIRYPKLSLICDETGKEFIPYGDFELANRSAFRLAMARHAVGSFTELLEYQETDEGYERDIPAGKDQNDGLTCFTVSFLATDRNGSGHNTEYRCFIEAEEADQALGIFFRAHPHVSYSMVQLFDQT